jgi:hypothetical protein
MASKEGLKEAQSMIRSLNMALFIISREKRWFLQPWLIKVEDRSHWAYVPLMQPTASEAKDGEVLRDLLSSMVSDENSHEGTLLSDPNLFDDGVDPLIVAGKECRDDVTNLLNGLENTLVAKK